MIVVNVLVVVTRDVAGDGVMVFTWVEQIGLKTVTGTFTVVVDVETWGIITDPN